MRRAFTLIELLVVITIIVVLLALLTPAMDQAIYSAELAVCAAKLDAVATGVQTYAMDYRRSYPYRAGVHQGGTTIDTGDTFLATSAWHPHKVWNGGGGAAAPDDRRLLRNYMGINAALNDPLSRKADLDGARAGSHTYASYYLWFGFKFAGNKGLDKVGDKLTWTEGGVSWRFDILAGDQDDVRFADAIPATFASHPDRSGLLRSELYQDAGSPQSVVSRWAIQGPGQRGTLDMNFVFAAGHVARVERVEADQDDRMIKVPVFNGGTHTLTQWSHLPRR
jgi:prepilin-type N-terminal cleavage/methylation domain-containing protein